MGEAAFESEIPFLSQPRPVAAVLCRTEHGNLHAGLLHRAKDGSAQVLHLGWQDYLYYEWAWPRLWAAPEVEPERLRSVGGLCRRIWKTYQETKRFPYGIRFAGTHFDVSGKLLLGEGASGLTCATFILAVFQSAGITLVMEDDWPVRPEADREFLENIQHFATQEHLKVLTREIAEGCKRIQPHEVLGACACVPLPAAFAAASQAGERVLQKLNASHSA